MNSLASDTKLLHALFESSAEGILVVDEQGTIVLANPACLYMFGYREEELMGKSLEVLVPSGQKASHVRFREGFFQEPKARPMGAGRQLYGRTKAGNTFPVEVSLSHMEVEGRHYAIGFIVDITKQKQVTDENNLLLKVFHESLNNIFIIDASNFRFIRANTVALKKTGYSLAEIQQLNAWDLTPDLDEPVFMQCMAPLLTGEKEKVILESVFSRKDRSCFPVEIHLQMFRYEAQELLTEIAIDIAERKEAEAALQKEKEIAQRYLDIAASIFVVLDKAGKVVLLNRRGSQILGYTEEEVIGKNWFEHFVPDDEKERVQQVFEEMMQGKLDGIGYFENAVATKYQEERLIEWHNAILYDEQGQPAATLSSGVDITEKRKAEQDVMKALIEGQEAERERIAKELHDGLGQSLTAMQLNLNALQAHCESIGPDAVQVFEQLKVILYNTTQDIKTISRNLMPGVLRDYGLVKGLEYLCRTLADLNHVQMRLQVYHMDRKLDTIQSIGLYRIAQELINNALKHGKATEINIQLIGHAKSVVLMIEDDGIGFEQTAIQTKNGFGLKNIKSRVKALNGSFLIDAHPGQGTSLTVEIPL